MLRWIATLFSPRTQVSPDTQAHGPRVTHDDKTIVLEAPEAIHTLAWNDVARVSIHTTDQGPFITDLFWHIEDEEAHEIVVPMGCSGEGDLLRAMQRRLDDFDNMAVIEAMGSAHTAAFLVWQRERTEPVERALRSAS